jgi:hypothetical protein
MGYYRAGDVGNPAGLQRGGSSGYNPTPSLKAVASGAAPDVGTSSGRSYRRMNPGNVKALRRSMRRVKSFAKLARSVMTFAAHHKMKHRRKR